MLKPLKKLFCVILFLTLAFPAARAEKIHTRNEVRNAWQQARQQWETSPYLTEPEIQAPYAAGEIQPQALEDAISYLNFIRYLAYIDTPVTLSRIYTYQCQHGATLMAALDYVDHDADRAPGMDDNFYDSAHNATLSSNIAKFNWMRPSIIREGVEYFVRDDGESNLSLLGHRRWLLNPEMSATGFGLANSESGMSYVLMYAHDFGNTDADWTEICWPSEGAFPAELMHSDLAWSVSLNPEKYQLSLCTPKITLTESETGLQFEFDPITGKSDGFCTLSFENYGAGPCLIFRPDFSETDFTDYQQNQCWQVSITGLYDQSGNAQSLEYTVEMIALQPIDPVNVEISQLEANISVGEVLSLTAQVIPRYADDLSIIWKSSDPTIATVSDQGMVTAHQAGQCQIIAESINGRWDYCALTVTAP